MSLQLSTLDEKIAKETNENNLAQILLPFSKYKTAQ